jgi:hypothetical protein
MERSLAGVLFLVAVVAISVSAGGWWMQRIVFTPDDTRSTAAAILEEPDIRLELNTVITGAAALTLEQSSTELSAMLETYVLSTRSGAVVMAPVIQQAHDRVIGLRDDEPIMVTGTELIPIVRDERAGDVDTITLPIQPIGVLKNTRSLLGWMIPISAAIGLLTLALGVLARPDRRDVLRGLGEFGIALAASMLVFGYLIPVQFLTAIDNRTWTHAIPRLAMRTLPVVLGSAVIFAVGGAALIVASRSGGKRRQWSTPLSVARYRGGNNPGWG